MKRERSVQREERLISKFRVKNKMHPGTASLVHTSPLRSSSVSSCSTTWQVERIVPRCLISSNVLRHSQILASKQPGTWRSCELRSSGTCSRQSQSRPQLLRCASTKNSSDCDVYAADERGCQEGAGATFRGLLLGTACKHMTMIFRPAVFTCCVYPSRETTHVFGGLVVSFVS
jgi:hypothetical protein